MTALLINSDYTVFRLGTEVCGGFLCAQNQQSDLPIYQEALACKTQEAVLKVLEMIRSNGECGIKLFIEKRSWCCTRCIPVLVDELKNEIEKTMVNERVSVESCMMALSTLCFYT